ncbi:uncharacterized protein VNE69_01009 [Vairimorpha necatrix]|uniref:Uncharacterized protein n=1 Tax=Vairimorpha necatrix TaxID=6039 RepID=A0AAX4J7L5_9MICR
MNFVGVIVVVFSVKANNSMFYVYKLVFNTIREVLLDKINNKDYISLDTNHSYEVLYVHCLHTEKRIQITTKNFTTIDEEYVERTYITEETDFSVISKFLENILNSHLYKSAHHKILVYDQILAELMNDILARNSVNIRKENYLSFNHIIENKSPMERMILEAKFNRHGVCIKSNYILTYFINERAILLRFYIKNSNIIRFFEVDCKKLGIKDLFIKILRKNDISKKYDKKIFDDALCLYDILVLSVIIKSTGDLKINCEADYIKTEASKTFKLNFNVKKQNDDLIFSYLNREIIYSIKNKDKNLTDWCKIYDRFYEIQNQEFKDIDTFYQIMKCNNKLEFLIKCIMKDKHSVLNAFLRNLCACLYGFELNDLQKITIKSLILNLDYDDEIVYMLKVCLFIEAENYINDNQMIYDPVFVKLKEIGQFYCNRNIINLINVFQQINNIKNDLLDVMQETWGDLFNIISLFSRDYKYFLFTNKLIDLETERFSELIAAEENVLKNTVKLLSNN